MGKLHNSQIISKLVATTPLTTISLLMRNFIANFVRILGICKDFAGNRVNELGNVPSLLSTGRCKISDLTEENIFRRVKIQFFARSSVDFLLDFANESIR